MLGVIPFLLYLILISDVNIEYVTLMKTLKLMFFVFFVLLFPVVMFCLFVYNMLLSGILGVLVLGVYFLYLASVVFLFFYLIVYVLLCYDIRLVLLGILPILFMFLKMSIIRLFSLCLLYFILFVTIGYL